MDSTLSPRDNFKSKLGFIASCVGSAVGMGNIWLFPYKLGQNGGAAFLIPYTLFMFVLGYSGVVGEMAFGRAMKAGPVRAFEKALKTRNIQGGNYLGIFPLLGCLLIGIGYAFVVGWIIKFIFGSLSGSLFNVEAATYFGEISGGFSSIPWHIAALVLTFSLMIFGVSGGIEKLNKIVMPIFFLIFLLLAVYVGFRSSSVQGYSYIFNLDLNSLKDPRVWINALGQAFFSLSLAGSGTIIYGSYLDSKTDIIFCAKNVVIFSFISSLLSALVIIPAVFSYGMINELQSGPPLMFIVMPTIFKSIPCGQFISLIFFLAALFAAVTSLVNLFEAPIEAFQTEFRLSRKTAVLVVASIAVGVGIFIEDANVVGKWMDFLSVYVVPLGALLAGIMFFWVCGKEFARDQVQMGRSKPIGRWFEPLTRYVFIGLVFVLCVLNIIF